MSVENSSYPTIRDLAYEIGLVQINWSFLESEMRRQLVVSESDADLAKGSVIVHWRNHLKKVLLDSPHPALVDHLKSLDELASQRNLLAHGIQSVSADPWSANSAFVVCRGTAGEMQRMPIEMIRRLATEIDAMRRWLGRVPLSFT